MRFVHITDTHVGPTPDHRVLGQQSLPALEALVKLINSLPFEPDFILHNGDIVDDGSEEAYALARQTLQKLKAPIFYVLGNHDQPRAMRKVLLGKAPSAERYDYYVRLNGIGLAVFDSRGPADPAGTLTADQLEALRDLCAGKGPPLIIALHHQPVQLDSVWLDKGWDANKRMVLDCSDAFMEAIAPARERIRAVLFGHVHRPCEVIRNGILFAAPPSACTQIFSFPPDNIPTPSPGELPGFNVVTITDDATILKQHTFPRPK